MPGGLRPQLVAVWVCLGALVVLPAALHGKTTYRLSFEDRLAHYVTVEVEVDGLSGASVDFQMAVWTPGSYLVREFARQVEILGAKSGRRELPVVQLDKRTWRVSLEGRRGLTLRYRVYAFEESVRTSYVDGDMALLNGASVFLYPVGREGQSVKVAVDMPKEWGQLTTALEQVGRSQTVFQARDLDELIDSPILAGNQVVLSFNVGGIPHQYAISGDGNYDPDSLVADTRKIFEQLHALFGSVPYDRYTIFLWLTDGGRGGLEHLGSTVLRATHWSFTPGAAYRRYLELVAHEVFHLYNVKRIRPAALGPFDYGRENYTTLLWVSEGLTSYYDRLLLRWAGLISVDDYLALVAEDIRELEQTPGRMVQSLSAASFNAWIKHYRRDENSPNSSISYYLKGSLVGLALDLSIRQASGGWRSLDDVFKTLWRHYEGDRKGFTHEEFRSACETAAGRSLEELFDYVTTTKEMAFEPLLTLAGLTLERTYSDSADSGRAYYGFEYTDEGGRLIIERVLHGSPGVRAGLSSGDELLAADGYRLTSRSAATILDGRNQGEEVSMTVSRQGQLRELSIRPDKPPYNQYTIVRLDSVDSSQSGLYASWLRSPWPAQ